MQDIVFTIFKDELLFASISFYSFCYFWHCFIM